MTGREALNIVANIENACEGLVSELGDPFHGFYKNGTAAFMRYLRETKNTTTFDARFTKRLLKIREVIQGLSSEMDDPFHGFIKGGTKELMRQLDSVLEALGVTFVKPVWTAFEYKTKEGETKWGITANPNDPKDSSAWALTGFRSKEEAEKTINEDWFKDAVAA